MTMAREGSLEAPTRHPIDWKNPDFYNEELLNKELERVYDICHGCRRCVSLCHAFPTLFDLVDESETMEVDGVAVADYMKVVDHCYLCDLCYLTKCPYVPPHEWQLDFPHLMLRAKAIDHKKNGTSFRNNLLSNTDAVGKTMSTPVLSQVVNFVNKIPLTRAVLDSTLGIHKSAHLPEYHSKTLTKRLKNHASNNEVKATDSTNGKVALFGTCYGEYNEPHLGEDLVAVFEHNKIPVQFINDAKCCGMPKMESGDLEAVEAAMHHNIPMLAKLVDEGFDLIAPVPSCALMFKQELPLLFPDNADVEKVGKAFFDPFEYLMLRHKAGELNTEFKNSLGKVAYHVACHQRVQNFGMKTRDLLQLIQDTEVTAIERCSGHDGTYAVKKEFHDISMKIAKPVINRVKQAEPDHYGSDCPMAGHQIANGMDDKKPEHPLTLLRQAYGI
ncbi:MAG: heterodisulfide reductase-related iron-sulfur binding cluster [Gammaproteobacteria bacterium]|nr:heterodisulfide reductase-related iron-sulfur binding cluster [Gammaproteobacteria bacterium]